MLAKRTGQTVSLSACHYLGTLDNDLKRLAALEGLSSSDRIIQFFQEKNYDYITLYNSLTDEFKRDTIDLVNDNFLTSNAVYTNTKFVVPAHEQSDISNYTLDNRNNRKLSKDQNLLVAMALVVPEERRLFILYPSNIFSRMKLLICLSTIAPSQENWNLSIEGGLDTLEVLFLFSSSFTSASAPTSA